MKYYFIVWFMIICNKILHFINIYNVAKYDLIKKKKLSNSHIMKKNVRNLIQT